MSKLKDPFPPKMQGLWIPLPVMILSAQGRVTPLEMLLLSQIVASVGEGQFKLTPYMCRACEAILSGSKEDTGCRG